MRIAMCVRACALLVVSAVSSLPAAATIVVLPTLEEMTHRSDVVVHGIVRDQKVIEDRPGRIVTVTSIEIVDGIAGAKAGDVITVHQLGGQLGKQQAWIAGAHHFSIGEELVFFGNTIPKKPGVVVPYGIGFGIFNVVDDVDGRHVLEVGGDVNQLIQHPDGSTEMKSITPRHFESLETFKLQLLAIRDGRNQPPLQQKRIVGPSRLRTPPAATPR